MTKDKIVGDHSFCFNPEDNGGESLIISTKFIWNGDDPPFKDAIYSNQEISLMSYGNSASFNLSGCELTPKNLRELANQLEVEYNKVVAKLEIEYVAKEAKEKRGTGRA